MAQNFEEINKKDDIIENMLFESIIEDCTLFMKLFGIPNSFKILENMILLIYNSFQLPNHKSRAAIEDSLLRLMNKKALIFDKNETKLLPSTVDQNLIKNMLRSKSELSNGNLLSFLEELLINVQPKLSISDILDIYGTISQEYHGTRSLFSYEDLPELSHKGKQLIMNNSWRQIHTNNFNLVFDHLAETNIFSLYFYKYFNILNQQKQILNFLPQEDEYYE